jgi:hypothetical protein
VALLREKVFESFGHCTDVTFHKGFTITLQLLQAPAAIFQDS